MNTQPTEQKPKRGRLTAGTVLGILALVAFVFVCIFVIPSLSLIHNPPTEEGNFDALALIVLLPMTLIFDGLLLIFGIPSAICLARPAKARHPLGLTLFILLLVALFVAAVLTVLLFV